MKIHIVDYDSGNLESIRNALKKVGCEPVTTNKASELINANAVIFPGQGSFPSAMDKLSQFDIRYNFFNADSPIEYGPKMWHRDNDSLFNQLKMFLVLNDLTDESGGHFYFIPQKIIPSYKKIYSYYKDNENFNKNDKNSRVKNIDIEEKYNLKNNIIKYGSDKSEALILDTNETYHKGGYIKNKGSYRILLQVIYEPAYLSISNYSKLYNNFIYRSLKIFLLGLKNRLRKTI